MMEANPPFGHVPHTLPLERIHERSPSPPAPPIPEAVPIPPAPPRKERLLGVDLARAIAIFGMFTVHVGPSPNGGGGVANLLLKLAQGRSAALFATLAGLSLMLITGRGRMKPGREARQVRVRIASRAVILILVGTALTMLGTAISVIIPYYGVYFLLALPLLRARVSTLVIAAALSALVGPLLTLAPMVVPSSWLDTIAAYDPINMLDGRGFLDLVFVGIYPAVSWMSYVFAGMALGRLDLGAASVRKRLAVVGVVLGLVGYGGSWLAVNVFTGVQATIDATAGATSATGSSYSPQGDGSLGELLLVASPHSGTSFELVGNIGVAILVLVLSVTALAALPRLRRIASPVIAVGAMSLTAYIGHLLVIRFVDVEKLLWSSPLAVLVVFVLVITVFAGVWSRFLRRGPLEYLLHISTTRLARLVK